MGNNTSQPTGHYHAGPQYQPPPTHFNHRHTLRETQHFRGGYTLRDPPKKKKMGLVGVPEYSPPNHHGSSNGYGLSTAAAQAAYSAPPSTGFAPQPAPQTYFNHGHSLRNTHFAPPQTISQPAHQHFSHGYSLRDTPNMAAFSSSKHSRSSKKFNSWTAPPQTLSQPTHQHFSHGHSLRNAPVQDQWSNSGKKRRSKKWW
ncbi:hypothetical protein FNAPI_13860 [Fusarium napiforme]|uniref:Uncharacterized protein n=1 Tax=Fusarium napiforme TaxID=42672 RepID=A0A8H5I370_9HYPO|nr:hypothetical protein FNAPI_13860 [Fusarium napiforme]